MVSLTCALLGQPYLTYVAVVIMCLVEVTIRAQNHAYRPIMPIIGATLGHSGPKDGDCAELWRVREHFFEQPGRRRRSLGTVGTHENLEIPDPGKDPPRRRPAGALTAQEETYSSRRSCELFIPAHRNPQTPFSGFLRVDSVCKTCITRTHNPVAHFLQVSTGSRALKTRLSVFISTSGYELFYTFFSL